MFDLPQWNGHTPTLTGCSQHACITVCAVQCAGRDRIITEIQTSQGAEAGRVPAAWLEAKVGLVQNQVYADCLFISMRGFAHIKTERLSDYCHFINLVVGLRYTCRADQK